MHIPCAKDDVGDPADSVVETARQPLRICMIIHSTDPDDLDAMRLAAAELRRKGHRVEGSITFEPGDAERFADAATRAGADLIIAAGGDGTLNGVVNGLLLGRSAPPAALPRLAIVPLGTANDFAGWLGIPRDVAAAVDLSIRGDEVVIDVARVNDRYFLNVSTGGFAAEATEEAPERTKRALGVVAYLAHGIRKLAALEPSNACFSSGDETLLDGEFLVFAVGNGRRTGGGNWIVPRADLGDGLLDVCIIPAMSHGEFLRLLPALRTGEHVDGHGVIYRQVPRLEVRSATELSVNADGESIDSRSLVYSVRPYALRLAVPAGGRLLVPPST